MVGKYRVWLTRRSEKKDRLLSGEQICGNPRWKQKDPLGGSAPMQVREEGSLDQDRADGDGVYRTSEWSHVERNRRQESRMTLGILIRQSGG